MSPLPDDITDRSIDNPHAAEVPIVTPGGRQRRSRSQRELRELPVLTPPLTAEQLRDAISGRHLVRNGPFVLSVALGQAERDELAETLARGYAISQGYAYGSTESVSYAYLLSREVADLPLVTIRRRRPKLSMAELESFSSRTLMSQLKDQREPGYLHWRRQIIDMIAAYSNCRRMAERSTVGCYTRARRIPTARVEEFAAELLQLAENRVAVLRNANGLAVTR